MSVLETMLILLVPAFGVAYIALAIWFLVRIVNRRASWVRAIVVLAATAALGAGLAAALLIAVIHQRYIRASVPSVTAPTAAQISEFTANAAITLPASAEPIAYREERGMDDALWLQVRMPAADLPALLGSSPFKDSKLGGTDKSIEGCFSAFWKAPPARYRSGQESLPNARVLNILIDESDPANVVVYLMWHET